VIEISLFLFWLLAGLAAGQALLASGFMLQLLRFKRTLVADAEAPEANVILCLRGGDPFLRDCISGLLNQDYPNYTVQVVVDHSDDPAMHVLREFSAGTSDGRLQIQTLVAPMDTCSLKCSSLVQAVRRLDKSVKFIALIDADTIPHRSWLRELASALQDERVGAATGNRWYMPANPSLGALVRYTWNAAAIVQMYWYRIAWGGTTAIKTSVFEGTDLLEKWSQALCEDTMLFKQLKRTGLRVEFVPSLMMINREDCDLESFFPWMRRQLVTARLYHPAWPAVVTHGFACSILPWLAVLIAVVGWFTGDVRTTFFATIGLVIYHLSNMLLLLPMEFAVRKIVVARGEESNWLGAGGILKVIGAMQVTQVLYGFALFSANHLTLVDWRGVSYRLGKKGQVKLEQYKKYTPANVNRSTSL
jgi:cellulose synthase/poly-beta-1,6-N-acetylglucosamine synthase-like glycosyltransferase